MVSQCYLLRITQLAIFFADIVLLLRCSRNALLKVEDRRKATCIYRSLLEAKDAVSKANVLESDPLLCGIRSAIEGAGVSVLTFTIFFKSKSSYFVDRHFLGLQRKVELLIMQRQSTSMISLH